MTHAQRNQTIIDAAKQLGFSASTNQVTGTQLKLGRFDARKLCELSIVMKQSIAESRDDRPSLYVGAVIYLPDGCVEFAYRGELRNGDHGEFAFARVGAIDALPGDSMTADPQRANYRAETARFPRGSCVFSTNEPNIAPERRDWDPTTHLTKRGRFLANTVDLSLGSCN